MIYVQQSLPFNLMLVVKLLLFGFRKCRADLFSASVMLGISACGTVV